MTIEAGLFLVALAFSVISIGGLSWATSRELRGAREDDEALEELLRR